MSFRPVQINCRNCGASLFFDPTIRLSECSYCGSHIVLDTVPLAGDWPTVDWIFEDRVERKAFQESLAQFFTEHPDTPDDLLDVHARLEQHLCFLPFFRYEVEFAGSWSADAGYYRTIEEQHYNETTKAWETRRRQVTDWSPASGTVDGICSFHAPAADQAQGLWALVTPLAEALDPLDRHSFDPQLLAGSSWLRFDTNPEQVYRIFVQARVEAEITARAEQMVPGDTHRNLRCQWRGDKTNDRELIPFWIYHYSYGGTIYSVAVDAVRGHLRGERPKTCGRRWAAATLAILPLGLAAALVWHLVNQNLPMNWLTLLLLVGLAVAGPLHFRSGITNRKHRFPQMGADERSHAIAALRRFQKTIFGIYGGLALGVALADLLLTPASSSYLTEQSSPAPSPTVPANPTQPPSQLDPTTSDPDPSASTDQEPEVSTTDPNTPDPHEAVYQVLNRFQAWVDAIQDPGADKFGFYADTLRYYLQKQFTRDQVLRAQADYYRSFYQKYDRLQLEVRNLSTDFPSPDVCEVTYEKKYTCIAKEGASNRSGTAYSHLTFSRIEGEWMITAEWDQKRRPEQF